MVTQGTLPAALWALVPAPASTIEAIYPPWVIPDAFKWFSLILVLNSYSVFEISLKRRPPLCLIKPGLVLSCSKFSDIFYNDKVIIINITNTKIKKYTTAFCRDTFILIF